MMNGIFLIDKHCQTTSRQLDNQVGRKFGIRKVGHVGTLDPLATGLMLIAVNEATKTIPFMEDSSKEYIATFKFGLLTTTLDLEGDVVEDKQVDEFSQDSLTRVLNQFKGRITQIPPLTSAIKVGGVPLYKYAHQNIKMDVPPRQVDIFELELLDYQHPFFTIRSKVSSGTYIRTLGHDIAHHLGTVATTIKLRRTKVGNFTINMAKTIENITEFDIMNIGDFLGHIPTMSVDEETAKRVKVGADISLKSSEIRVKIFFEGRLLAIYQKREEQTYHCLRGFNL